MDEMALNCCELRSELEMKTNLLSVAEARFIESDEKLIEARNQLSEVLFTLSEVQQRSWTFEMEAAKLVDNEKKLKEYEEQLTECHLKLQNISSNPEGVLLFDTQTSLRKSQDKIRNLEEKLQFCELKMKKYENILEESEHELTESRRYSKILGDRCQELDMKLHNNITESQSKISTQHDIKIYEIRIKEFQGLFEDRENQLLEKNAINDKMKHQLEDFEIEIKRKNRQIFELDATCQKLNNIITNMEKEIQDVKLELINAETLSHESCNKLKINKDLLQTAEQNLEHLTTENKELLLQLTHHDNSNNNNNKDIGTINSDNIYISERDIQLKSVTQKLKETSKELSESHVLLAESRRKEMAAEKDLLLLQVQLLEKTEDIQLLERDLMNRKKCPNGNDNKSDKENALTNCNCNINRDKLYGPVSATLDNTSRMLQAEDNLKRNMIRIQQLENCLRIEENRSKAAETRLQETESSLRSTLDSLREAEDHIEESGMHLKAVTMRLSETEIQLSASMQCAKEFENRIRSMEAVTVTVAVDDNSHTTSEYISKYNEVFVELTQLKSHTSALQTRGEMRERQLALVKGELSDSRELIEALERKLSDTESCRSSISKSINNRNDSDRDRDLEKDEMHAANEVLKSRIVILESLLGKPSFGTYGEDKDIGKKGAEEETGDGVDRYPYIGIFGNDSKKQQPSRIFSHDDHNNKNEQSASEFTDRLKHTTDRLQGTERYLQEVEDRLRETEDKLGVAESTLEQRDRDLHDAMRKLEVSESTVRDLDGRLKHQSKLLTEGERLLKILHERLKQSQDYNENNRLMLELSDMKGQWSAANEEVICLERKLSVVQERLRGLLEQFPGLCTEPFAMLLQESMVELVDLCEGVAPSSSTKSIIRGNDLGYRNTSGKHVDVKCATNGLPVTIFDTTKIDQKEKLSSVYGHVPERDSADLRATQKELRQTKVHLINKGSESRVYNESDGTDTDDEDTESTPQKSKTSANVACTASTETDARGNEEEDVALLSVLKTKLAQERAWRIEAEELAVQMSRQSGKGYLKTNSGFEEPVCALRRQISTRLKKTLTE
eukprot:gene1356-2622_t